MDATPRGATLSRILRSISPLRSNTMPALRTTPATIPLATFPLRATSPSPRRYSTYDTTHRRSLPPFSYFPYDASPSSHNHDATSPSIPRAQPAARPRKPHRLALPPLHNHEG